jgi:hypothetical protein
MLAVMGVAVLGPVAPVTASYDQPDTASDALEPAEPATESLQPAVSDDQLGTAALQPVVFTMSGYGRRIMPCPAGYSCYYEHSGGAGQHPSDGYGFGEKWIAPSCGTHHFTGDLQPWSDRISFIQNNGPGTIKMYNWEERWVYLGAVYPHRQVNLASTYANDKIDRIEITCDGSRLGDCPETWMTFAEGNGPAEKFVLSMTPTPKARSFSNKIPFRDLYVTNEIWKDLRKCTPFPERLNKNQRSSLFLQLLCHVQFNAPNPLSDGKWFGGPEWDLESWYRDMSYDEIVLTQCGNKS